MDDSGFEEGGGEARRCPICGAPNAPMGWGNYSCRRCGMWYSAKRGRGRRA